MLTQANQGDADDYVIRYTGYIDIQAAGEYTFYTTSDDGSTLSIDNNLVVNNDGLHGNRTVSGTYTFATPGYYPIEVEYFEATGDANLKLEYESSDAAIPRQNIPGSKLSAIGDDEDGISSFSTLKTDDGSYSVSVEVNNTTATAANLLGWIDFNQNGVFDTGEAASSIQTVAANSGTTTKTLIWNTLPADTKTGTTYARFRLGTDALTNASSAGALGNGEVEDYQLTVVDVDYGDAPDIGGGTGAGNYKTTKADGGASHTIVSGLSLGSTADGDSGSLHNGAATADDTTNNGTADDEDGIASFSTLKTDDGSYSVSVEVNNTVGAANLIGWIDFNQDGIFQSTEAATATVANLAGVQTKVLNWSSIPANTKAGTTYARFRLSTDTALTTSTPNGALGNGEVEDYQLTVAGVDYGDAPDIGGGTGAGNYKTTKADGGASHTIVSGLSLGSTADGDSGTLQNGAATADDTTNNGAANDEDGIASFSTLKTDNGSYSVSVEVNNTTATAANLLGWIDFNQNGVFDTGEAASSIQTVAANSGTTTKTLIWNTLPADTKTGTTYARFRLGTDALTNASSTGALGNGEVEDYQLTVVGVDYGDAPDTLSGGVDAATRDLPDYQTTDGDSGASHLVDEDCPITIGDTVDSDDGTQQNATATADGADEDGVTISGTTDSLDDADILAISGTTYSIDVEVNTSPTITPGATRTVSGQVFIDYDNDGVNDATTTINFDNGAGSTTTSETGIDATGITVTAYANDGSVLDTAITDASGNYSLDINQPARIEFTDIPDGYSISSQDSACCGYCS